MSPGGGVVDVRWAHPAETVRSTALLDGREQERLARLSRADDRARFVAAHALLRLLVGARWRVDPAAVAVTATCRRCQGAHGRPVVDDSSPGEQQELNEASSGGATKKLTVQQRHRTSKGERGRGPDRRGRRSVCVMVGVRIAGGSGMEATIDRG